MKWPTALLTRLTGAPEWAARCTLIIIITTAVTIVFATYSANILTTWVQSWVQAQDAKADKTASMQRWAGNRDTLHRVDNNVSKILERACAGR